MGLSTAAADEQNAAQHLFTKKCASCHTVGGGNRVGPDLKGLMERRQIDWVRRFIKDPATMLDRDPTAKQLLAEYKNVRMPVLGLTSAQVDEVIQLIAGCDSGDCNFGPDLDPIIEATAYDYEWGRDLFLGTESLENGAPPCMSCHSVAGAGGFVPGGRLAKDLTFVFARLGDAGLDAALRSPAFPLMKDIFAEHPLTEDEIWALRAFLYDVNRKLREAQASNVILLVAVPGVLLVLLILQLIWRRRLRGVRAPLVANGRTS